MADPEEELTPFSGPGAAWAASEALKANRAQLMGLQSTLSLPLTRLFRSPEDLASDLLPYVLRMLSPDVKPVLVNTGASGSKSFATASVRKASEKALVKKAVEAMAATGVRFEKSRIETEDSFRSNTGFVWRMEPPLDVLATFDTLSAKDDKVRFAVRSVLESEWRKESAIMNASARQNRGGLTGQVHDPSTQIRTPESGDVRVHPKATKVQRDFFGRIVAAPVGEAAIAEAERRAKETAKSNGEGRIWVSFHEGFSNAVRKPIGIDELLRGL